MFSLHHCQVGNAGHGKRNLVCLGTGKPGSALPGVGLQGQAGHAMLTTGLQLTLLALITEPAMDPSFVVEFYIESGEIV